MLGGDGEKGEFGSRTIGPNNGNLTVQDMFINRECVDQQKQH